eukprot:g3760.t1
MGKLATSAVCVIALAAAVLLAPRGENRGFYDSLDPIQVFSPAQLSPEEFRERFVLTGTPVIIDFGNDGKLFDLDEAVRICGARNVSIAKHGHRATVAALEAAGPWLGHLIGLLFGARPATWLARLERPTPFREIVRRVRAHSSRDAPERFPALATGLSALGRLAGGAGGRHVDRVLRMVGTIMLSPIYLADHIVADFCPEMLESAALRAARSRQAAYLDPRWLAERVGGRGAHPQSVVPPLRNDHETKFFLGPPYSIAYPLHIDHGDGDVFTQMLSGCKEAVVLRGSDREGGDYADRWWLPGTLGYGIDVFDHARPPAGGGVQGFRAMLRPGQLLFMCPSMRHVYRNRCPDTVSLVDRPWRTSMLEQVLEASLPVSTSRSVH